MVLLFIRVYIYKLVTLCCINYFRKKIVHIKRKKKTFIMSYSEVRNFTETIRSLGYPGQLNLSTFFRPNFTVMTDILRWLIDSFSNSNSGISGKRLIDSSELPIELDTETDRVMFVKAAAQLLASRLNIKIHTKRLYQADVMCISELSKLSSVLYKAMHSLKNP